MAKVIPVLPCAGIEEQCAFYESIGFTTVAKYKAPNAYAVVQYCDVVLHFWGSRKHEPSGNASMVFIEVDDVDEVNAAFCESIKRQRGKIPRSGMPRITKVRELKEDRRFTVCDPAGNTLYVSTPNDGKPVALRTLDNERYAKQFAAVYDLQHSHESPEKAAKALAVFMRFKDELNDSDKKKLAILTEEIERAFNNPDAD